MSLSFGDAPRATKKPLPTPDEARRIALTHASTLQIRKFLELSTLNSLTYLVDLPTGFRATASHPTPRDTQFFKHHLRHFTPSDYDSLLEERSIADKCGYTLCPHPPKRTPLGSRLARTATGNWVPREQMERFCSHECARRALWVRLQLPTEPAWARNEVVGAATVDENTGEVSGMDLESMEGEGGAWIRLLEEEVGGGGMRDEEKRLKEDLAEVGVRKVVGEGGKGKERVGEGETVVDVVEREAEGLVVPPDEGEVEAIEGFVPRSGRRRKSEA
ncbi:Rtr1/RPAP2 family-domain-containing protein [Sphaerosporella brunnea]|uniref:RNA polymerase II subunit B1 CTD phosphatase RPAP2 homolog n=1 Tax=Sphaerosporella brunnea TaxID=1250544 RepID=A0A5J5EI80_9PEZI|nr:Rtr1/RPAP2 family-domain-containing protein [Sphaerosporella brunnea]